MFRQDLVLRIIDQFGLFWGRIVRDLRAGLFPSTRATLDQTYEEVLGLAPDAVRILSTPELLARMQFEVPPDVGRERGYILATLLDGEAQLVEQQQDEDGAAQFRQKVLEMLLALALQFEQQVPPDYAPPLEHVLAALEDYQLPPSTNRLLFRYYEQIGAYASAEDRLFELYEQLPGDQALIAQGEAFYRRLQSYSEAQLQAGDFSRREVKDGLKAWRRLTQPPNA